MRIAIVDDEMQEYIKFYSKHFLHNDDVLFFDDVEKFVFLQRENFSFFDVIIGDFFNKYCNLSCVDMKRIFNGYKYIFCSSVQFESFKNAENFFGLIDKNKLNSNNYKLREYLCQKIRE